MDLSGARRIKVCLWYVSTTTPGWASYFQGGPVEGTALSHGIATLASAIKAKHDCFMADLRSFKDLDSVEDVSRGLQYDAAIVWVKTEDWRLAREVCAILSRTKAKVPMVVAGPAVSVGACAAFPGVGAYLLGEPEKWWDKAVLAASLGGEPQTIGSFQAPGVMMDDLPDPDRGIANIEIEKGSPWLPGSKTPVYTMAVGRHCPACYDADFLGASFGCANCVRPDGTSKYPRRMKTPQRVVDDVYRLSGSHGTGGIGLLAFHDTQFATGAWLREFASEWAGMVRRIPLYLPLDPAVITADSGIVRELAKIGMWWCSLDIGSGSKRLRKVLGVQRSVEEDLFAMEVVRRNRVNLALHCLEGLPGETDVECGETEDVIRAAQASWVSAKWWRPTPGTTLFDECSEKGLLAMEKHPDGLFDSPWLKVIDGARLYRRVRGWASAYQAPFLSWPDEPGPAPQEPRRPLVTPAAEFGGTPSSPLEPKTSPHGSPVPLVEGKFGDIRLQQERLIERDTRKRAAGWKPPRVTCVIVSFNRPDFIREAFHSLEAQTLPKDQWECVFIESGSTDKRVHEFVDYKDNQVAFPNVKVIRHSEDVNNVATCWNEAMEVAAGEFICLLDDDNRKHPKYFEEMIAALDANPDKVVVHCRSQVIDVHGNERGHRGRTGDFTLDEELKGNFVDSGEMMFRRSCVREIGPFDERCKACEDWDFICRLKSRWPDGFLFVDKVLTDYRAHNTNRMHTSIQLGSEKCANLLIGKHPSRTQNDFKMDVRLVAPPDAALTQSQKQVISGIRDGLAKVPFVRMPSYGPDEYNANVVFVVAPFRLGQPQIDELRLRLEMTVPRPIVVSLHMEDPQAVVANARMLGISDWIVANDIAAARWYQKKREESGEVDKDGVPGHRRVLVWNSLGVSDLAARVVESAKGVEKDVGLLILGYPYPTRARIVREMLRAAPTTWRILAIGDGWDKELAGIPFVRTMPTLDEEQSIRWGCRAKVIVSTHRRQDDCGGFPVMPPESVHRGFLEASFGAAVLIDSERSFGDARMRFTRFKDGAEAAAKAFELLRDEPKRKAIADHNQMIALTECTFESRLTDVLNCIRGQRWGAVVR